MTDYAEYALTRDGVAIGHEIVDLTQPLMPQLNAFRAMHNATGAVPVDPSQLLRDRQIVALRAAAPMRGRSGQHSRDITGLPMFQGDLLL